MDKMGREAIISIGSNVPDKRERVEKACEELKNRFYSFQVSSIYTTPAVGRCAGQPDYCNAVARFSTTDDYETLRLFFKTMESDYGRVRHSDAVALIPLDIDIVMWDGAHRCQSLAQAKRQRDMGQEYMRIGLEQLGLL